MALGSRENAIHALINVWLKLPGFTCATCGSDYIPGEPCCDHQVIGNNEDLMKVFLKELRQIRETRLNSYGSNKRKDLRIGVSLPATLYQFLDKSMRKLYNERLFTDKHNMVWFAKKFPAFKVPELL